MAVGNTLTNDFFKIDCRVCMDPIRDYNTNRDFFVDQVHTSHQSRAAILDEAAPLVVQNLRRA